MKVFIPLVIFILATAIFFGLTMPAIKDDGGVNTLRKEKKELETALDNANKSEEKLTALEREYNSIDEESAKRLDALLPSQENDIRLIIYLNNIGTANRLSLKNISVKQIEGEKGASVATSSRDYNQVETNFTLSGTYEQFLSFLSEMEKSLRILDIIFLSFESKDKNIYDYTLTVRAYWQPSL